MKAVQQEVRQRTLSSKEDREAILRLQSGLAATAARRPRWRFHNLYPVLGRQVWLEEALDAVLDNAGAETPGIDGMRGSALDTPSTRQLFLQKLQRELKRRRYRPSPTLRVYIPKPSGDKRPLGIPTLRDRTVQMALKMLLEPIFEADFVPNSNGFRPDRSTLECVLPTYRYGDQHNQYNWIIEADIKGCFDNINHRILLKAVGRRIADKKILKLIKRFLRTHIVERGARTSIARKGTPQGGVVSPFLSNVYLHRFDRFWWKNWGGLTRNQQYQRLKHQANCVLFRYADDFILMARGTESQAEQIKETITQYFREKLRLELNPEKTRVIPLSKGFSFLGFRIPKVQATHGEYIRIRPTQKNVMRLIDKLRRMLGKHANSDDPIMKLLSLNRVLRGWGNYYKAVNAQRQFATIDYISKEQYFQWMARKTKTTKECQRAKGARYKRDNLEVTLFELSSLKSERTSMDHKRVWKYRHIGNPYLSDTVQNKIIEEEQPIVNEREIHPIAKEYRNEIYLENRMKRFKIDGWKCLLCNSRVGLVAHHVERVPKGGFDPVIIHRVKNLRTVCTACHKKIKMQPSLLQ